MYHGIEVWEIVRKLVIGWVGSELEKLCAQFGLHIRVFGEFDQRPLISQDLSLDVSDVTIQSVFSIPSYRLE